MSTPTPVGEKFPEYPVPIERGKIREFATATQSIAPEYQEPDAVIPPTFLAVSSFWAPEGSRPDTGFDRKRLLHGEQEYIFHGGLPRAGDVLAASSYIADRYERAGKRGGVMRFAVVVTDYRNSAGELVVEQRSTLIERAKPAEQPGEKA